MAKRIAVSAETSATVTSTKASIAKRKKDRTVRICPLFAQADYQADYSVLRALLPAKCRQHRNSFIPALLCQKRSWTCLPEYHLTNAPPAFQSAACRLGADARPGRRAHGTCSAWNLRSQPFRFSRKSDRSLLAWNCQQPSFQPEFPRASRTVPIQSLRFFLPAFWNVPGLS